VDFLQVQVAVGTRELGDAIAGLLIRRRLAGCAQVIGPIQSTYHWQGAVEVATEWLVLAKTRQEHYAALEAAVTAAHPYAVPEIIATAIVAGSEAYLRWLRDETPTESDTQP
jgi:periplasmic divalent cation tolerance protein